MRGYLLLRKKANSWKKHWFIIKDNVLYFYKASEDVVALQTEVLLGWEVVGCSSSIDGHDPDLLFKIAHLGRPTYIFKAESVEFKHRWMTALTDACVLK
jgi:FYVE/RhoGEF/PH domain-containing protein 5/6